MNFFKKLFKPKEYKKYGLAQYLYHQAQAILFEHYRWCEKQITEQEYIMGVDEIIGKMYNEIRDSGSDDKPPEWLIPKVYKPKKRRRKEK